MHPLDNPIWQALTTSQAHFARAGKLARRFPNDVTSLAGFTEPTQDGYDSLAAILDDVPATGLFFDSPQQPPAGWTRITGAPLLQMIHENGKLPAGSAPGSSATEIVELVAEDAPEMLALAQLTKPGPFGLRTRELGTYLGIKQAGALAAMAGERLHVPGFTEVSAVCTHPDYLGRGYAGRLMTTLMKRIHSRGEVPFLHVREDNVRAIALYERLGFRTRVRLHFAVFRKPLPQEK
ncbi:MAG: GNAT family N-acetyltransferase [Candidatus Acidiferrales bacterium]